MAGIDLTGLTLNPIEVQDIKDFIVERVYEHPQIQAIHDFQTGINVKEQIAFASQFGKTGLKKSTVSCDIQTSSPKSILTEKFWDPIGIEDALIICQTTVDKLFKAYYTKVKQYKELYDITGSDMEIFYAVLIVETIVMTIWRGAWYGDTAAAAAGAGTPGLVDAGNVKFYDYFDGIWKQIFAGVAATDIQRVTITENAIITSKANQLALAAGAAEVYMRAVRANADPRLKSDTTAVYLMTNELFDNYEEYLLDKGVVYDINIMQNGLKALKYRGHMVINMETIWDIDSREDFVNNTTDNVYYLPHRIVMTNKFNIPIGTLNTDDFDQLEQWYEKKERKNYTTWGFTEDAKVLEEYMMSVAY